MEEVSTVKAVESCTLPRFSIEKQNTDHPILTNLYIKTILYMRPVLLLTTSQLASAKLLSARVEQKQSKIAKFGWKVLKRLAHELALSYFLSVEARASLHQKHPDKLLTMPRTFRKDSQVAFKPFRLKFSPNCLRTKLHLGKCCFNVIAQWVGIVELCAISWR